MAAEKEVSIEKKPELWPSAIATAISQPFTIVQLLENGNTAQVFLVKHVDTGKLYAMKQYKKDTLKPKCLYAEVEIFEQLADFPHPRVVQYYGVVETADAICFLLEYLPGGELFRLIESKGALGEHQTRKYALQILDGLSHLHEHKILYRDLKPENLMLDAQGNIKLVDFGFSKREMDETSRTHTICGTPQYLAPEVILGQPYGRSVDWWCFGLLIYEMLLGHLPFRCLLEDKILNRKRLHEQILNDKIPFPSSLSPHACSLLQGLLQKNPKKRLGCQKGAAEIRQHPFFQHMETRLSFAKKSGDFSVGANALTKKSGDFSVGANALTKSGLSPCASSVLVEHMAIALTQTSPFAQHCSTRPFFATLKSKSFP